MIRLTLDGPTMTPGRVKALRRLVEGEMERNGMSGRSASGRSAMMAIEWCESNAQGWTLSHVNGAGYSVEAWTL